MPTQAVPTLTALPTPPNPGVPSTFASLAFAFTVAQRDVFQPQMQALGANVKVNADDAILSASTATTQAATATTQAGLATTNGAAQVSLATTQAATATTQANNASTSASAAAASSSTAAQASVLPGHVSGTNYSAGQRAISLINGRAYFSLSAGVSTIDPANDPGRWQLVTANRPVIVVAGTAVTAVSGNHYVMTNAALSTLTLPATPPTGAVVQITFANGRADNVVARNGSGLLVTTAGVPVLEDLVFDSPGTSITLEYASNAWRFSTESAGVASALLFGQAPILNHAGTALTAINIDAGRYTRFANAAAKTYTFTSTEVFTVGAEFHGRNVGAGNLTLTAGGTFVLNAPASGTLVIPPGGVFGVKIVGAAEADVFGVTT